MPCGSEVDASFEQPAGRGRALRVARHLGATGNTTQGVNNTQANIDHSMFAKPHG